MVGVSTLEGALTVKANVPSDCTGDCLREEGGSLHISNYVYLQRYRT